MKRIVFKFEVELGNEAMKTAQHIIDAVTRHLATLPPDEDLTQKVVGGIVRDEFGNRVGRWEIA